MEDAIKDQSTDSGKVEKARANVRLSLTATVDWRKAAREDFRFVQGKQWDSADVESMRKQKRPTITINRCRPLINQVSGYFGQNMSEVDYLPRSVGDDEICYIAKGVNKYVYDKCMFNRHKKKVSRDRLICGKGYYWVFYDFDYDKMDGTIKIERRSPFEVFVDPESVKEDLSDAEFCGVYSWEDPDELALVYPEVAEEIKGLYHKYDAEELAADTVGGEPVWYSKQLKKLRVVQYWYKERSFRNVYQFDGQPDMLEETDELSSMDKLGVPGIKKHRIPSCNIKFMTFCDDVLFEGKDSPYKHKKFPLVQEFAYYTGEKDENDATLEPAGIIRDLKDVQREVNKHRSQRMDIVNKQANGTWVLYGQSNPEFDAEFKKHASTPGAILHAPPGITKIDRLTPDGVSAANVEMERASGEDFYMISGINPETMGSINVPGDMSGVAIDRRQKASFMQVSDLADEANYSERLIQDLLWGDKGRPGLIPQYFTEQMVMRIVGDDGEHKFIQLANDLPQAQVKQPVIDPQTGQPQIDEQGQLIQRVLYDLSKFEFDIVVVPSQSTPTLMQSTLYQLIDAQKAGIPIPPEMLLEFIPMSNKQGVRKKMQDQAASADKIPPPKVSLSVNYADVDPVDQAALLKAAGLPGDINAITQTKILKTPPKPPVQGGISMQSR